MEHKGFISIDVETSDKSIKDSKKMGLIVISSFTIIKAICDLFLFFYSFRVLNFFAKHLQPNQNMLQFILRMCANVIFTILFFSGILLKEIICIGIPWLFGPNRRDLLTIIYNLQIVDATLTNIIVYLAYAFAFAVLGLLYHFGSVINPKN